MTDGNITKYRNESGNALFLILIAVALFAALSYAITESGRGSGNVNKEQDMITAGEVVQQPAAVKTAMTRMIITGTSASSITYGTTSDENDVFYSTGGGATNVPPPSGACVDANDCKAGWVYTGEGSSTTGIFVQGVGTVAPDLLAVLQGTSGVTLSVCNAINKGLGFSTAYSTTPPSASNAVAWKTLTGTYAAGGSTSTVYDDATAAPGAPGALVGEDFACFNNGGAGVYAYYHTLVAQ